MHRYIRSGFHSIVAGMTLALSGLVGVPGWTGEAQAATNGSVIGEVEAITLDPPGDKWAGGTIVVGGQIVTIPRNLLMDLPANRLTLQELFFYAPTACKAAVPPQTGLVKGETCNAYGTGANVSISANRTAPGGNLIAGDVFIQKGAESFAGAVTYINYAEGYFRLGGTVGSATNGVMVRLNDPDSRHTIQTGLGCQPGFAQAGLTNNCSPDVRFTLDPDNYTNVFTTGYPMCIPSTTARTFNEATVLFNGAPGTFDLNRDGDTADLIPVAALADGSGDLLCPLTNRTVNNGLPVDDSRRLAPIRLGDNVVADGNWEIINGTRFLSAHSTTVSAALTTQNLPDQPDYMFLNEVEIDVAGFQNQRARTLIIGFVTLAVPTADVMIWSLHYDPVNNAPHELPLASVVGCELASGAGTCAAQGLGGVAGNNIFKIRHDVDFNVGADPKVNPCAHLLGDIRMPRVCNNNALGLNIGEMLGILSPIPHEIQARTGHKVAFGAALKTVDINGLEATNGQYLFPFGMNLGGISTPEFDEIDLNAMATPLFFSGIPWNLDRRLSPGGCDGPCEGIPQPLTPFPYEGLDPRTQTNLPLGLYNDPIFTDATLTDVRNRILTFVAPTGRANGNATVLAHPPVNPAAFAIAATPNPVVPGGGGAFAQAPVITSTPVLTATVGVPYLYQVTATDANVGDVLAYSLVAPIPVGMAIDPALGLITWTPTVGQAGPNAVTVRVTDQTTLFATQSFTVTVAAPPVITSTAILTATVGVAYSYQVVATDVNGGPFTYGLDVAPAGMAISATGLITWTPTAAQLGPNAVTVRVTDNTTLFTTQSFSVTVAATPAQVAPVITSTAVLTGTVGVAYSYQVVATDVNGGPFTYGLDVAPAGMAINATGLITWTPAAGQVGANAVTVRVTDNTTLFATQPFSVTVAAAPAGPTITGFTLRSSNTLTGQGRLANPVATPLTNGLTVSLAACGTTCRFNFEALLAGAASSVRLTLDGVGNNESAAPYTKPGDAGVGNYSPMVLSQGAHTITAQPRNGNGNPIGTPLTVTFTVAP
jgi:Putative Ig domain